jgi:hypothetical protein
LQLKHQISSLVLEKLREHEANISRLLSLINHAGEVTKTKVSRMFYQNFDENITAKYGVVIKNWPLQKFCSPGDIGSRIELKVLYQSWQSGATYFQKLSREELSQWEEDQFQARLQETQDSTGSPGASMGPRRSGNIDGRNVGVADGVDTTNGAVDDLNTTNGAADDLNAANGTTGGFNATGDGTGMGSGNVNGGSISGGTGAGDDLPPGRKSH